MREKVLLPLCLVLSFIGTYASPAQSNAPAQAPQEQEFDTARIMIDDYFVLRVRGIKAYPAKRRAREIAANIKKIATNRQIKTESIVVVESELASYIMAGEERILAVLDVDASMEQVDRKVLAQAYVSKVREAIEKYRHARDPDRLLKAALYAVLLTVALIGVLFLLKILYRKLSSFLESKYKKKIQTLQIQSLEIVKAERIWTILTSALRAIRLTLIIVLLYAYFNSVLSLFPWTRLLAYNLATYVFSPLREIGEGFLNYIPNFIFITIFIFIAHYLLKLIRLFFAGIEKKTISFHGFDSEWARPTYKIIRVFIIIFSIVILYPYIPGANSPAFKGISIFVGVIVSLGSSTAISNIVAGYTMVYRRTFKIGDRVKVGEFTGDVTEMRLLVTHLRSLKNEEIIVPNSLILGSSVINYSSISREQSLILHTNVTIGYDAPWRQVEAMLLTAAGNTTNVLKEPKPFVLQKSLDDFYVNYELNAYTNAPQVMPQTYSELHKNILDAFNEAGVQIMSPHYEGDPANEKVVPKEKWFTPPAKRPKDPGTSK